MKHPKDKKAKKAWPDVKEPKQKPVTLSGPAIRMSALRERILQTDLPHDEQTRAC